MDDSCLLTRSLLLLRKYDKLVYSVGSIYISELHQACYLSFNKQDWPKHQKGGGGIKQRMNFLYSKPLKIKATHGANGMYY